MATLEKQDGSPLLPREDIVSSGVIALLNAELICEVEGSSIASLDLRDTFVLQVTVSGTVDGTNWIDLPIMLDGVNQWAAIASAPGVYFAQVQGFKQIRARVSSYTSGSAIATLRTSISNIPVSNFYRPEPTTQVVRTYGAANTATTLTIPAAGAGLFHYITLLQIKRVNESLTGLSGTAVLTYTTTNLPGSLAWVVGNSLSLWTEKLDVELEVASSPLKSLTANTNTTIVTPAGGLGVRTEIIALYKVGR